MTSKVQCYSVRNFGDMYLSPNFQVKEFACKDGADEVYIDLRLVHILQQIRDYFNAAVTINSAYRTKAHNAAVGGAKSSQHLYGKAADITISGVYPADVAKYAERLLVGTGGVGRYKTFTHVDVRDQASRWSG